MRRPDGPSPLQFAGLGFELAVPLLVGVFGGQWLDRRFGTTPWLLLVGAMLGAAAITRSGPFALGGFLAMALPGIASGLWLVRAHGRPGGGFVIGLASGFVARLVLTAVGAYFAARAGGGAPVALLTGLAAGFVPMFLWEMIWFGRAAMAARPSAGARR